MSVLRSMTGHGEGRAEAGGWSATVTLRAVNHRHLDVRWSGPSGFARAEPEVRAWVKERVRRGRVEVRTHLESVRSAEGSVDKDRVWALAKELEAVRAAAGVEEGVSLTHLLQAGVLREERERVEIPETVDAVHRAAFDTAMDAFEAFRAREGAAVAQTFSSHVLALRDIVGHVAELREAELDGYRERVRGRVEAALTKHAGHPLDAGRLEQEIVLLAERSDIAEEIQRAGTHLDALDAALAAEGPHGKRLDFLLQELIRETNTMASKSISAALTHQVVEAKSLIEQLREQAANVE